VKDFWVDKLKPLVDRDLVLRDVLLKRGIINDTYHPELEKLQLENSIKFEALISKNGFPVLSSAGDEAVRLAWLIIQHSISRPDFMRFCLEQMRLAAGQQDYPLELLAHTEDRVRYFEGLGQLFGTQLDWIGGELLPVEIELPQEVNVRRRGMGLPPLVITSHHYGEEKPPQNPKKKEAELQKWLKKVGWRS
jgi:hypothetical protein